MSNTMLSNYLLQPEGLVALLALIPLIIFYLVKPKPEEQLLPSLRFFMEDKKDGRINQALSKILRNLMLIFHIFFVAAVAFTIAGPFVNAEASSEQNVVILDNSASMENEIEQARDFIGRNLGEDNTLIVVNDDVDVVTEEASASQIRSEVSRIEAEQTPTNMVSALQTAQSFEGDLIIASDMDHSTDSQELDSILNDISANRNVEAMQTENQNSWGIVGLSSQQEWVEIKNYEESSQTITISLGNERREAELQPQEVRRVNIELQKGENTVSLPEDGFKADNNAYIYIPQSKNLDTALISDERNQYLHKALELINSTNPEYYSTPVENTPKSDIYVIGESENLLAQTVSSIEKEVNNGATLVVFGHENMDEGYFSSLPVENIGSTNSVDVEFNNPRTVAIGQTQVLDADLNGSSLSDPERALVQGRYGRGDVIFYNIDDSDFQTDFLYPIFWKNLLNTYSEVETAKDVNVRTGYAEGILSSESELTQTGFHNTSQGMVAANLVNEDESSPSTYKPEAVEGSQTTVKKNIQNQLSVILLLLVLAEFAYLIYVGDIEW